MPKTSKNLRKINVLGRSRGPKRAAKEGPGVPRRPQLAQEGPNVVHDEAKEAPRRTKVAPLWAKMAPG